MLRWSIASVCMGGALEVKLAAAAKAGFRALELFENDLTFFNGKPRDVRRMAADLGIEIVALQPLRDFEAMPEPIRGRNFERAARKLELMHELGVETPLPLLQCLAGSDRRSGASRGRPGGARRSRPPERHAHRLRGAELGPARERLDGRLGDRARCRSRQSRHRARQLSCLRARQSDRADRGSAGRDASRSSRWLTRRRWSWIRCR